MHKKLPPAQWRDEITLWLESLTAAGLSQDTINTRRCKIGHAARCLDKSPYDVTSEDLVHWTASQSWKAETRKGYRNTLAGFFRWLHTTGRRADDPAVALPKVRKTRPHPRPCPDVHIRAAMSAATDTERLMLRLGAEAGLRLSEIAAVHSRDVLEGDAGPIAHSAGQGRQATHSANFGRSGAPHTGRVRLVVPRPMVGTRRKILRVSTHQQGAAGRLGPALAAPPVRHARVREHARSAAGVETAGAQQRGDHANLRGDAG